MAEKKLEKLSRNEIRDILEQAQVDFILRYLKWSGRYTYSSWKISHKKILEIEKQAIIGRRIQANPAYMLREVQLASEIPFVLDKGFTTIRLHIDIDGTDPLDVVSGTVARWGRFTILPVSRHFIGQVSSKTAVIDGLNLVVEDCNFNWPRTGKEIDRIEINLTNIRRPVASVTFHCTAAGSSYGPYEISRSSTYFREVEFEIDREDGARTVEPYNTHTHPDRPADLPEQNLTIKTAYSRAGVKVNYSEEDNVIATAGAGEGGWTNEELHQAMEDHWSAFANIPQWKLWVFLGEHHANSSYAGIIFDTTSTEPGDVERQGTAVFTETDWLFGATGDFASDNSNPDEAIERELFFTTVHEIGHAFNLAHSWQKTLAAPYGFPWTPPSWAPAMSDDSQGLSFMNYPWQADTDPVDTYCAKWFYDRFTFRFEDSENLYIRHAPEKYVQMGNEAWFENHGLAKEERFNKALELQIRSRRNPLELGEAVFIELRLRNLSAKTIQTHGLLDPAAGFTQIAITNPDGRKQPLIPPIHIDQRCVPKVLKPNDAIYESVQLTAGKLGFHFKKPGAYRIEACYTSQDGTQASAVTQIWIRPASFDDERIINVLYEGRVARALYFGGARKMDDVNDKLDWILSNLSPKHPARTYIASCLATPFAKDWKRIDAVAKKIKLLKADYDKTEKILAPIMENLELLANSLGHIKAKEVAEIYTRSAIKARKVSKAQAVSKGLISIFKKRKVLDSVVKEITDNQKKMK